MKDLIGLAWRYIRHYPLRSSLLVLCIALVIVLPLAVHLLMGRYEQSIRGRAEATPLVAGAVGSRYDLVLNSLYFAGRVPRAMSMADVKALDTRKPGTVVPLLIRHRASDHAIVGTTLDYMRARGVTVANGRGLRVLGDCVLGSEVARSLSLGPGDHILSDRNHLYRFGMEYPLRMRVVGVLSPTHGPDDHAVFTDIKTTWVMEGIGHGHEAGEDQPTDRASKDANGQWVFNAEAVEYTEIDPNNVDRFHFHGDPSTFPVTAVLLWPRNDREATIVQGKFRSHQRIQLLAPSGVMAEILGLVSSLKTFLDANLLLVLLACALFLALIVLLTLRVRAREMDTLYKLGCAKNTQAKLISLELLILIGAGIAVGLLLALGASAWIAGQLPLSL